MAHIAAVSLIICAVVISGASIFMLSYKIEQCDCTYASQILGGNFNCTECDYSASNCSPDHFGATCPLGCSLSANQGLMYSPTCIGPVGSTNNTIWNDNHGVRKFTSMFYFGIEVAAFAACIVVGLVYYKFCYLQRGTHERLYDLT
eukprot:TRINITY_DN15059_c0_g1_i1.p1 TRINITY_DN15059_c0_g1~~TRINITY_DN15059_c0_g1_i1.p1  ORF type:complete len:146 (-),score=17.99 TRINITY_DN15059_c0_g1_i1:144-581(-)